MPLRAIPSHARYQAAALAAVTIAVLALGGIVARDLRQTEQDAIQMYDRFGDGLDFIDEVLFQTGEVRRIMLYALHTTDANRQLQYAEQSRAGEVAVRRLLESRSALSANPRTRLGVAGVAAAWQEYLVVRDEVIGLILEGSPSEGVALDEQRGTARFNAVRAQIANLKKDFEDEAERQTTAQRASMRRSVTRLSLIVAIALLATAIGVYLINRRAALEDLVRSEAHKGSILQAVPDAIISTDEQGHIIELNKAAERTFGFTRAAALGQPIDALIVAEQERGAVTTLFSRAWLASGSAPPTAETIGRRSNGGEFPMGMAAATHTAGRERIWTLHVADMTQQRDAEEQLRRARDAAEAAARVKTDFLATMSHELRTPLTGVVGVADLLDGADLKPAERDLIRMLRSSATTLLGLVSDILDYTRIEAGLLTVAPSPFRLHDLIEEALDPIAGAAAQKGLEIGYVIDPGVPPLLADRERVRQVLINLVSNAVKFTETGEVAIRASASVGEDDRVAVTVTVRDTGIGIPRHLQYKLFERFSQIEQPGARQFGGAGLGLAISERLSRLLGGSLTVESREGEGAAFAFTFSGQRIDISSPTGRTAGGLSGRRVLVFLRPGIVRDQVVTLLHEWGVTVVTPRGVRPAPPRGAKADIVLVDAEAEGGSLYAAVIGNRRKWGLQSVPLVTIVRLRASIQRLAIQSGAVLTTPIRAQALFEALHGPVPQTPAPTTERRPFVGVELAILLVEDNDANRRIVRLMLAELGLDADEASSGDDAVARARERHYDVILMDVQMSDVDGLEATRRIRAEQRGTPSVILALTANVMESDEARCREAGMNGYLPKPLRLATLEEALTALISQPS